MKSEDATRECHAVFEKLLTDSKDSIELKIKELSELFSKEVEKLERFSDVVTQKVNVLIGATTRFVEDISIGF